MTTTQLLAELALLGVQLEARGDRLRYSPRSAVTPDLVDRIKARKLELLAILDSAADAQVEETGEVCRNLTDEMFRRVNRAVPRDFILSKDDWLRLDPIHEEIAAGHQRGNATTVRQAVACYEEMVRLILKRGCLRIE
jgi:hypothetical protein